MPFRIEVAADIAACARTVPIQGEVWSGDVAVRCARRTDGAYLLGPAPPKRGEA